MSNNETSTDEIAKVLTALGDRFARDEFEAHRETIEEFLKAHDKLPTGREFEREHLRARTRETNALIDALLVSFDGGSNEELWRMKLYLKHFSTVKTQLSALITKFEGSACSVDKSNVLLRAYEKLEINTRRGDRSRPMEDFESEIHALLARAWVTPREDLLCAWFELIDQFLVLLAGQPDGYLKAYEHLVSAYGEDNS